MLLGVVLIMETARAADSDGSSDSDKNPAPPPPTGTRADSDLANIDNPVGGRETDFVSRSMVCVFGDGGTDSCQEDTEKMIMEMAQLVANPTKYTASFPNADSDLLSRMCSPTLDIPLGNNSIGVPPCIPALHTAVSTFYASLLLQTDEDTCNTTSEIGEVAGASVGIIGLLSEFLCMENAHGVPCTTAVAEAIQASGMSGSFTGHLDVSNGMPNVTQGCSAFAEAGCCAQAFFDLVPIYQRLTCMGSSMETQLLMMLPGECDLLKAPLPTSCPGLSDPMEFLEFAPKYCPGSAANLWQGVAKQCNPSYFPTESCPTNMCQFGCLAGNSMLDVEGPIMDKNTILSVKPSLVAASTTEAQKSLWHIIGPIFGNLGAISLWGVTQVITLGIFAVALLIMVRACCCIEPQGPRPGEDEGDIAPGVSAQTSKNTSYGAVNSVEPMNTI